MSDATNPKYWPKNESKSIRKMKYTIKESQLHKIIAESVKKVLKEHGRNNVNEGLFGNMFGKKVPKQETDAQIISRCVKNMAKSKWKQILEKNGIKVSWAIYIYEDEHHRDNTEKDDYMVGKWGITNPTVVLDIVSEYKDYPMYCYTDIDCDVNKEYGRVVDAILHETHACFNVFEYDAMHMS